MPRSRVAVNALPCPEKDMANWYQRKPSDDAKIIMLLRLGKVELAIASLELCQHHCEQETDDIPAGVEPYMRELQALALVPSVDDILRSLKTKRRNRGGTTWHHVEPDKRREEQKREEKKPVAPSGLSGFIDQQNEFTRFMPAK
jgi:hypothetical protein